MKKNNVFVFLLLLIFIGWNPSPVPSQDQMSSKYENMNILTIPPTEMVRPTENEEAMIAYNIGSHFMYENRLNEAESYLKEAIELDPEFVDALDHLGIVYRRQNRLDEAEKMYLKSIELYDKNKVPLINLAVVYRLQNRLNDAYELYSKLVELDPNDPEGYFGIGSLFFIVENYDNAMIFLNIAEELYINQNSSYVSSVYFYKGLICFNTGKDDEALRYLEEAKKGNPNNEIIDRTINEIRNRR